MSLDPAQLLRDMFAAAVASAQPAARIPHYLPDPPKGRTLIIGAGKASAAMAQAFERHWPGPLEGLIVTRYGYEVPCERIEILQAGHPVPDAAGLRAAARILEFVTELTPDDLVVCLISGGGSALMPLPLPGLSLADKQRISRELLRSGASISEINTVRRHLSAIKGGRLAAACHPARIVNLLISDVPGDAPGDIASGPTVGDPTIRQEALDLLDRYHIDASSAIHTALADSTAESVKPHDPRLAHIQTHLIATPQQALEAAAAVAHKVGVTPHILSDRIEGEAREVGTCLAGVALQTARRAMPFQPPCVLLSGGETTVTVRGHGRGGRNVEFLLALGIALKGQMGIHAIACDTDGVDGLEEIAGGLWRPDSLERAWAKNINPHAALADNDGHGFFAALDDAIGTGPTWTNVNDFRAIFVE